MPIVLASIFILIIEFRRWYEAHIGFSVFISVTNFITSIMMGIALSYFSDGFFEFYYKQPAPNFFINAGGVVGALLSGKGFNFIVGKIVGLFDRVVDIFLGRYGGGR